MSPEWIQGYDCSFARPTPAAAAAAGMRFGAYYLALGSTHKWLTRPEADGLDALGVGIVVVIEGAEDWMLDGFAAGVAAANLLLLQTAGLGRVFLPAAYLAADFDVPPTAVSSVLGAVSGAEVILGGGRVGLYGRPDLLAAARSQSITRYTWLAASRGPRDSLDATIVQQLGGLTIGGVDVDGDVATTSDYLLWNGAQDDMYTQSDRDKVDALARDEEARAHLILRGEVRTPAGAWVRDPAHRYNLADIAGRLDAIEAAMAADRA